MKFNISFNQYTQEEKDKFLNKLIELSEDDDVEELKRLEKDNPQLFDILIYTNDKIIFRRACQLQSMNVIDYIWKRYKEDNDKQYEHLKKENQHIELSITLKKFLEERYDESLKNGKVHVLDYILFHTQLLTKEGVYGRLPEILYTKTLNNEVSKYAVDLLNKPNLFKEQVFDNKMGRNYANLYQMNSFLRGNAEIFLYMLEKEHIVKLFLKYVLDHPDIAVCNKDSIRLVDSIASLPKISTSYLRDFYKKTICEAIKHNNIPLLEYFIIEKSCPQDYMNQLLDGQLKLMYYYPEKQRNEMKYRVNEIYKKNILFIKLNKTIIDKSKEEEPVKRLKI